MIGGEGLGVPHHPGSTRRFSALALALAARRAASASAMVLKLPKYLSPSRAS